MITEVKTIGGYIELQLPQGNEHYPALIKLNTGRNALEYLLRIKKYTLVHLPYFTCEVLLEPLCRLNIPYRFYHIDSMLNPILDFEPGPTECLVYTNYFGLMQETVKKLSGQLNNLIIDNAQAFFSPPLEGIDTFYSCRKFFGVPDGAYLQANSNTRLSLDHDISIGRFSHLIKSIDLNIESAYPDYIRNNVCLVDNSIKKMSLLTQKILSGIDYEDCEKIRNANFKHLHKALSEKNELTIEVTDLKAPMVYPLLINNPELKQKLIDRKVFVATYWPNVLDWTTEDMLEHYLCKNIIPLPIDHRYHISDMDYMIDILKQLL
ncbi:hypothetical protein [Pedobacter nyackensis]|uniref:dTDP-4-amino-4,6-dideoxygalactose transaminase n=1 Tax=Pedobacter nyackensis TaxID=475255 RepID=A0A1W2DCM3_9SPHI|nr:hypothetical protein [Pedobacter nyackensis]SMC95210.1 hypothetical protein SAMN04488101_106200 [Pedobacter nyackensis]